MKYHTLIIILLEIIIIFILVFILILPSGGLAGLITSLSFIQIVISIKFKQKTWVRDTLIIQFMILLTLTLAIIFPLKISSV